MDKLYKNFPENPGVYLMKNSKGGILYIGKAVNLKRRVKSYFERPHDFRIQKMVSEIRKIDYKETDSALEALILEAELIKKYEPPYNIREKDDKSFLYVEFTKEKFPRVLLVRGKSLASGKRYGPFLSGASLKEALRILRKIFPYSVHSTEIGRDPKPCFDYQIGLCPGTCVGAINKIDYLKNIRNLKLFFNGKKKRILSSLEKEMNTAAQSLEYEKAYEFKAKIFALTHIQDMALLKEENFQFPSSDSEDSRIEGYDISNISGTSAVGSMVVFKGGAPDKNEYRKFRIQTIHGPDDTGMIKEVLRRRLHNNWPLPDLLLIDGGMGQVNAARSVLMEFGFKIPVIGIAKGPERKKNEFVGTIPKGFNEKDLIKVRDEAHRFAVSYHRKIRSAKSFN